MRLKALTSRDISLPFQLKTVLPALGMTLCWLTPNHFMPWLSFDGDFGMCTVVTLLAWSFWITTSGRFNIPKPALAVLFLAFVPLLQFGAGLVYYVGDAWIFAGALLGFGLSIATGSAMQQRETSVTDMVLSAALCASLVSVGIEFWQWLRLSGVEEFSGLGLWMMRLPVGMRPFANLAQPNQLSTLLLWGLVGLWWTFVRQRIGGATALFSALYLLSGLAMTQSRSGWIGLAMLTTLAWAYRRSLGSARHAGAFLALLIYFSVLTLAWSDINDALYLSAAESLENRLSGGARVLNWKICVAALVQKPWSGFGWGQIAVAQQSALLSGPASGEYFAYAHNVVLDLLLWNGIPLGSLVVVSFGAWLAGRLRRVVSAEGAVLAMAIVVLLVHALLEYPHAYFYFLLPAGLMLGALAVVTPGTRTVAVPHALVGMLLAAATVLIAWVAHDYAQAASNMERLRFEAARIGTSRHSEPPDILLLTQLREYLFTSRIDVNQPLDAATLERLGKTARRYASDSTLFRHAMAAAISGRPDVAADTLRRLCRLQVRDHCESVRTAWQEQARAKHPEMAAILAQIER